MFVVIAYDIMSDQRRTKVMKLLKDYGGKGVNLSVFECTVTVKEFETIRTKLSAIINPRKDTLIYYRVCDACKKKRITVGIEQDTNEERTVVTV